jgi:anti-sigma factor RsiW
MTCDEFEAMGLDAGRDPSLSEAERIAAAKHVNSCPRCAALEHSWQGVRAELYSLAEETATAESPARLEMRLRQQFRTQHSAPKVRRVAVATAWALTAAAVIVGVVSWTEWRSNQQHVAGNSSNSSPATDKSLATSANTVAIPGSTEDNADANSQTLVAGGELSGFTLLPGVLPTDTEDAAILRVRMQRGALGALGLPVNEDLASEWIQVDLLVGDDGSPQAVRLLQE